MTTRPAMQPDMTSTADIHSCLADKRLLPAEHFVNFTYVDAGLPVSSQRGYAISLEGPVHGMANQFARANGFKQRHLTID